jgi:hypothetical protein
MSKEVSPEIPSITFQKGIPLPIAPGCSIQAFLCDRLGLTPTYVEGRITTVFLNGKVVDNLVTAYLQDGDILALSAAMPGLVGATLRRNGALSMMRASITQGQSAPEKPHLPSATVVVKLFNLLIEELGPFLLEEKNRAS